jgi:hypothetical protein
MRLLAFFLSWWKRWTAPVPAPVSTKSADISKPSTRTVSNPAPVPPRTVSAPDPVPAPVPPVKSCPLPADQARALLEFLHRDYAGMKLRAIDVKAICYPQLLDAMNWRPQPWDGTDGVGKHFARLTGGRTFGRWPENGKRKRQRAYGIPVAIEVRKRA